MASAAKQKQIVCLVYAREEPQKFEGGLLGSIDMQRLSFLVDNQGNLPKEPAGKAEERMRILCKNLELPILSVNLYKNFLVVRVNSAENPIHEQMSWREIDPKDSTALGWRTVLYPTMADTFQECLGFSAAAKKDSIGGLYTVASILPFMLAETP